MKSFSFLLCRSVAGLRGTQDEVITPREASVLCERELSDCSIRYGCFRHRCKERSPPFHLNSALGNQLSLKRALQIQSPADRHSRTTKLIAARQDVETKSCRVNTGMTRLLKGRRSLAPWLSDRRRLLCNRAGSAAAGSTSPTSFSFSRSGWN